jgi:plastocyanin
MYWKHACAIALAHILSYSAAASQISGKITLEKKLARKTVAGPVYDLRGVAVPDGEYQPSSSNEFEKVAVWLDGPNAPLPAPVVSTLQQRNKRFEPDLVVVPVGSTVEFPNVDPIFHNIFSLSRTESFDLGYYSEGHSRSVKFPRAGIVQVYCHVHPEMHAVIIVTSTAWAGKPRQNGTFAWPNIPPGKYRLYVWQRSTGLTHRGVSVPENGEAYVNISLPAASEN